MFLLVLAYPGSPRQKAVKRLCVCVCVCVRACVRACMRACVHEWLVIVTELLLCVEKQQGSTSPHIIVTDVHNSNLQ